MSLCIKYAKIHTSLPPSPVIPWIELGGKPKWLPINSGYGDVMHMAHYVIVTRIYWSTHCVYNNERINVRHTQHFLLEVCSVNIHAIFFNVNLSLFLSSLFIVERFAFRLRQTLTVTVILLVSAKQLLPVLRYWKVSWTEVTLTIGFASATSQRRNRKNWFWTKTASHTKACWETADQPKNGPALVRSLISSEMWHTKQWKSCQNCPDLSTKE